MKKCRLIAASHSQGNDWFHSGSISTGTAAVQMINSRQFTLRSQQPPPLLTRTNDEKKTKRPQGSLRRDDVKRESDHQPSSNKSVSFRIIPDTTLKILFRKSSREPIFFDERISHQRRKL